MTRVQRIGPASVAAVLTLAVHVLLLAPLVTRTREVRMPAPGSSMVLISLDDTSELVTHPAPSLPPVELAAAAIEIPEPRIDLQNPDDDAVPPPYVLYIGQVTARVQRLWTVPVARAGAELHCRARIQRGPAGEVVDLTLQPCDDDATLKASVREAIHLAAPLPTRPDPEASAEILTLDFSVFAANAGGRRSSVQPGS